MNTEQRKTEQRNLSHRIDEFETHIDCDRLGQMYPIYINCDLCRFKVEEISEKGFDFIVDTDCDMLLVLDKQFSEGEYPDPVSAVVRLLETGIEIPCWVSKSHRDLEV